MLITLMCRVNELHALMAEFLYMIFHRQGYSETTSYILLNVLSDFHYIQSIHLLLFFLKPHSMKHEAALHTLDVLQSLSFVLNMTNIFRSLPRARLFVSIAERPKGMSMLQLEASFPAHRERHVIVPLELA